MLLKVLLTLCGLHLVNSQCTPVGNFIAYGTGCGDTLTVDPAENVLVSLSNLTYQGKNYSSVRLIRKTASIIFGDPASGLSDVYQSFPNPNYPGSAADHPMVAVFHAWHNLFGNIQQTFSKATIVPGDARMANITNLIRTGFSHTAASWTPQHAAVFTWTNAPYQACGTSCSSIQNAYQLVMGWDYANTYAILNYGNIMWTEQAGQSALVGFNRGAGAGWTALPVNATDLKDTYGSDVKGRYIYRISGDTVERGGCLSVSGGSFSLYVTNSRGPIMGGDIIGVSGPCITSGQNLTGFNCIFSKDGTNYQVQAFRLPDSVSSFTLNCITPRVWKTGVYKLRLTDPNTTSIFQADFTYVGPDKISAPIITITNRESVFPRIFHSEGITITWDVTGLKSENNASLSILGYGENSNVHELVQLGKVDIPNDGNYTIDASDMTCTVSQCANHHIGFITLSTYSTPKRTIWSPVIPLGWYVNQYMTALSGAGWADTMCNAAPAAAASFDWSVIECPCNISQAEADSGRLMKTTYCPRLPNSDCSSASSTQDCFSHIVPYSDATPAAAMCCYDQTTGFLIYGEDTSYSRLDDHGSYTTLIHKDAQAPVFSHWYKDILPFLYCCHWRVNTNLCARISVIRPTTACQKFIPGRIASAFGDPHFIPFMSSARFTFNGKGEFWLLKTATMNIKIQGRFMHSQVPAKGTLIQAVAFQLGTGSKYEITLNKEQTINAWIVRRNGLIIVTEDTETGVLIKSISQGPNNPDELFVGLKVDYGKQVGMTLTAQRKTSEKYMDVIIGITPALKSQTTGLLGEWSANAASSGLINPVTTLQVPLANTANLTYMHNFGVQWRITESESLFFYQLSLTYVLINVLNYEPSFSVTPSAGTLTFCGSSTFCAFDKETLTSDPNYAAQTLQAETTFDRLLLPFFNVTTYCGRPSVCPGEINNTIYQLGEKVTLTSCFFETLAEPLFFECTLNPSDNTGVWIPFNIFTTTIDSTSLVSISTTPIPSGSGIDLRTIIISVVVASLVVALLIIGSIVAINWHQKSPKVSPGNGMEMG